jgi:hypothetical protein
MGSIKLAAHLENISGKVGTGVYAKNRGGLYLRNKVTPANPNTSYQQTARAYLTLASAAWKNLTDAKRLAWEALALQIKAVNRVGIEYARSGFSVFVSCYCNAKWIGASPLSDAPALILGATLLTLTVTNDGDSIGVAFTPTPVPTGNKLMIYACPPVSAGVSFVKSEYRFLIAAPAATSSAIDIGENYEARFGSVGEEGEKTFFKAQFIHTDTFLPGNVLSAYGIVEP